MPIVGQSVDKVSIEEAFVTGKGGPLYTQGIGKSSGSILGWKIPQVDLNVHLCWSLCEITLSQK